MRIDRHAYPRSCAHLRSGTSAHAFKAYRVLAGKMLAVYVGALQQHKLDFIHALADDSLSSSDTSEWHPCSFRCQRGRLDSAAGPVYWHLGLCTLRVPVLTEYFRVLSSQYVGVLWRGHLIFFTKVLKSIVLFFCPRLLSKKVQPCE